MITLFDIGEETKIKVNYSLKISFDSERGQIAQRVFIG